MDDWSDRAYNSNCRDEDRLVDNTAAGRQKTISILKFSFVPTAAWSTGRERSGPLLVGAARWPENTAIYRTGATLALKMAARACSAAAGALERAIRACFGAASALKMAAQACPGATSALEKAALARCSAASVLNIAALARSGVPMRPK